jgi:hypothetical protein
MSKYFFSTILFLLPIIVAAQSSNDSSTIVPPKIVMNSGHQLRINIDISRPIYNAAYKNKTSYEFLIDYYLQNDIYAIVEAGLGNSDINYDNLKYTSNNPFLRLGMDKAIFPRTKANDWGMALIGFRYGVAMVNRSEAYYTTNDGLGETTSGTTPAKNFTAHWFELTGGMRVELFKNTFAGWNVRAKFMLNPNSFGDLKPAYIAGFGNGDKGSAFDFNFYVGYAFRWAKKKE